MSKAFDIGLEALAGPPLPSMPSGQQTSHHLAGGLDSIHLLSAPGARPGAGKSFYIETFGCQMNAHDSEKVAGVLLARGYAPAPTLAGADLLLYNTCSIREKAAQKVFSRLGEFRDVAPGKTIAVLGCLAQQEGEEIFERAPWVSLVCGSASYRRLPDLVAQVEAGGRRVTGLDLDAEDTFETEITRRDNPFRAYLTIIEGCDYACSYCVVPHTRGPERSRTSESVLAEARRLAQAGYTEIQLLGQTVNSYRDPSPAGVNFPDILRAVAATPGIRRVRFTTSHPNDFSREIVAAIDETPVLCDHIHLPVQSGSPRILQAMRRTYTREEYLDKISWIRAARRPITVTTDLIVGFPGETEHDFADTLALLDVVRFDGVFAFTYSPRPNTDAAALPGAIPEEEKGRRLAVLLERQRQIQSERHQALVGSTLEILVDAHRPARSQWSGRSTGNRIVNFTSPRENLLGEYVQVSILRAGPNSLIGEHAI